MLNGRMTEQTDVVVIAALLLRKMNGLTITGTIATIVAQKWRNTKVILHKIKPTQILPIVMILLDLGAAAVCAWHKEYKKAVYWVSAAVLNATVTF